MDESAALSGLDVKTSGLAQNPAHCMAYKNYIYYK